MVLFPFVDFSFDMALFTDVYLLLIASSEVVFIFFCVK